MKLLLDTHSFLWFITNDPKLSANAHGLISGPQNVVLVSPASYWEVAIKVSLKEYPLTVPFEIFAGKVKTVVVWKLDRLSRRLKDGVNLLADWCERGLRVVVVTQAIDLTGPVGRMIAAVLLGLAEIEWEYRRERQSAGIAVAKKKGVYRGRRPGSTKGNPARAAELRGRGLLPGEIATALGTSERTVRRYLARK